MKYARELVSLGLVFMWSALLTSVVLLAIRALIIRELGLDANGLFQAAWGISGMFAGFILGAMATDFYPRLTAVANDHGAVNRLVNEQTEVGILLALPGLMGTLAFAPWMMHVLFSAKFIPGADLLPWFVLGVFGQVISWPMGFVVIAKNKKWWFFATTTLANLLNLALTYWFLKTMGLVGAAIAMPVLYLVYTLLVLLVSRHLTGFCWNHHALRLLGASGLIVLCGFTAARVLPEAAGLVVGGILAIASAIFSLRGLARRLGKDHRLIRAAFRVPGGKWLLGS
jgi:PST family polysaccharide transporter